MLKESAMKTIELSDLAPAIAGAVKASEQEDFVVLIDGKPGGHLLWFANEDDAFEFSLTSDSRFKERVSAARKRFKEGKGIPLDEAKKRFGL